MATNTFGTVQNSGQSAIDELRARINGEVILPGDDQYEEARKVRGFIHNTYPAIIVRVASPEDVAECVRFCRTRNVRFSVRGGGHSLAGYSVVAGTLVIDMSDMKSVDIDAERQTARVQGGARSYDLAEPAHEAGFALSTGDSGTVGFGGLVTGGGIGYFVRKYGLAADRLLTAKVVTANGDCITASALQNSDLFWAIRGGGGNFGIVVEFEFQLVPHKFVVGGALVLPATRETLRGYLNYVPIAPDSLSTIGNIVLAPPAPFIPEEYVGKRVLLVLAAFAGDPAEADAALAPLRTLAEPIVDTIDTIPYPVMFQYMEWAEAPHGASIRMMFTDEIPDATIDDCIDAIDNVSSPFSAVHFRGLGGQLARHPMESTAFVHRDRKYFVAIIGVWFDQEDKGDAHRAWTEALWNKIQHLRNGVYVNFLEAEGEARVREAYPEAVYAKLAEVKGKYDPDNIFQFNQNVRPETVARQLAA